MAKFNISFNNKDYSIDETSLSFATDALKSHLSTAMAGSGANIEFDGVSYGIDSAKLTAATNEFISHLGTVSGSGHKVIVGGVEYGVDFAKVADAVTELETVLSGLGEERLEGDGQEYFTLAPTSLTFRSTAPLNELQEVQVNGVTVDPANYTLEEGSTVVTLLVDYLKTLNADNYDISILSENSSASGNFSVVEPELNKYQFYYNQPYTAYVPVFGQNESFFIREDGTMDIIETPSGFISGATYSIDGSSITVISETAGTLTGTISSDGTEIFCNELQTAFKIGDTSVAADNDYVYIYKEDLGGYEVKCIDKTKSEYGAIKTGVNGIKTVKLGQIMFYGNNNLIVAPKIPFDVTIIGDAAFYECTGLTSVEIHEGVTSIEDWAFSGCTRLTNVVIPNSITSIGKSVFSGTGLTNVVIPDSVTSIGQSAFWNCISLTNVKIPDSVTSIEDNAFEKCTGLTSVTFNGTMAQWNAVSKGFRWNADVPATKVTCSDGVVTLQQ